ncbi:hypothetical protein [Sneathiella sp.]|jgi:hypothetical protein|uniref:hypothetical protein n=1 Tax=Sneathiella sp. TaxID=1964365 RepID=UPI0039E6DA52
MMRFFGSMAIVMLVFIMGLPSVSNADEISWPAEFLPEDNHDGRSSLVIKISEAVRTAEESNFAVELDNIDITGLVEQTPDALIFKPIETLQPGYHTLRLYQVTGSGEYIEQHFWEFTVQENSVLVTNGSSEQGSAAQTVASDTQSAPEGLTVEASADNNIEISQRLFDSNIASSPNDLTISGSGNGALNMTGGRWTFDATGNYFIESEEDLSVTGNEIDLGEYTINLGYRGDAVNGSAILGHQDIGIESLSMSSYMRRGASISVGAADDRLKFTGFSLSSDSLAGADDFTGLQKKSGHVTGGAVVGRPVWHEDTKIELTGLYFASEGGEDDFGSGGGLTSDSAPKGSGGALIADSYWGQDRLRLRGELAFSNMDLDGSGSLGTDFADAETVDISYVLIPDDGQSDVPLSMTVGGKWEQVDTFFYSLANQGLSVDRNSYSVFSNLYWGALNLNAQASYETNNTADLADVATDQVMMAGVDGSYSFSIDRETPDDRAWLGTPFVGFGFNLVDADRKETPLGYLGDQTDNISVNYYANVGSSYERWNWQLSYNRSTFTDETEVSSDTTDQTVDLSAYWTVSDALNLSLGTSYNQYVQKADGERSYNVTGNLGVQASLIPQTLTTNINYNMNLSSGSGDLPDKHILSGEMEWTFIPADVNRPGVALAFRGAMEKENGNSDNALDDAKYEGFIVLRLKAPVVY